MNVAIQINNGRDAIPVRAIPFLTDWQKFSPDVLAAVLAQDDETLFQNGMRGLTAYRMDGDGVRAIPAHWWSSFTYRELRALSDAIRARQETQDTGYQDWREQSIRILPAGVFVWRDEFEAGYAKSLDRWQRVAGAVLDSLVLNLRPDIPTKYPASLILEGFNTPRQGSQDNGDKRESKDERVVRWADWFVEEKRINERGAYARVAKREEAINPNTPHRRTIERAIIKELDRRAREERASKVWPVR